MGPFAVLPRCTEMLTHVCVTFFRALLTAAPAPTEPEASKLPARHEKPGWADQDTEHQISLPCKGSISRHWEALVQQLQRNNTTQAPSKATSVPVTPHGGRGDIVLLLPVLVTTGLVRGVVRGRAEHCWGWISVPTVL